MQVAKILVQLKSEHPGEITLDSFKLPFRSVLVSEGKATKEEDNGEVQLSPDFDWDAYPPEVKEWAKATQEDIAKYRWQDQLGGKGILRAQITREEALRIRALPLEEAVRERRRIALEQKAAREANAINSRS